MVVALFMIAMGKLNIFSGWLCLIQIDALSFNSSLFLDVTDDIDVWRYLYVGKIENIQRKKERVYIHCWS